MKERLIELINSYPCMSTAEDNFMESISADLADYLLDNGVVVVDTHVVSPKNLPLITHIASYPIDEVISLMEANEAGRIVELPCKVGDAVYMPWEFDGTKGVAILTVTHIIFDTLHAYIKTDLISDCDEYLATYNYGKFSFDEFGKTVFLTKEEAEKELNERLKK